MPSIYDLKPAFQQTLKPCMLLLSRWGVTPNQITLLALGLSVLGGVLLWQAPQHPKLLLLMPVILFVRMALNALDGMLARTYGQSTPLGEILNELGDVLADACLYLPLIGLLQQSMLAILCVTSFVLLGALCEFSGVLAKAMIGVRRYDGPMGKSDRAFAVSLFCVAYWLWPLFLSDWATVIFVGLNNLLVLSCLNRTRAILQHRAV